MITEEVFLISPCSSLELCIQMGMSFLSLLVFTYLLFTVICKASSDSHFSFLHFFFFRMVSIPVSCTMSWTSVHTSSSTVSISSSSLNLFLTFTVVVYHKINLYCRQNLHITSLEYSTYYLRKKNSNSIIFYIKKKIPGNISQYETNITLIHRSNKDMIRRGNYRGTSIINTIIKVNKSNSAIYKKIIHYGQESFFSGI